MSYVLNHSNQSTIAGRLAILLSKAGAKARSAYLTYVSRKLLRSLTDRQLADCGIDRAAAFGNVPVIEVERGVIDRLMNAR